ncbi:cytochrome c [Paeniroseomonas aquatica]|uniref:Cytochrome c n=1 Tax=Paeniroseomonas aquatica TaxID=373043 RepID=A0ABT8AE72_9PROT|nr:cytochrome c [Paeniroseomonas aquatica]MDN3568114.1 cytochrome c [Paeniroseomonas aquatica]
MRAGVWAIMAAWFCCAGAAVAQEEAALLARGRSLVEGVAACGNCHTPKGPDGELPGMALAGGLVIEEPGLFRAVVPNITPDEETGLGRWTDAQVALAIREGRRPDGSLIGPPMPIELYRGIADRDLAAMVVYLRSVPAVRNAVAGSSAYQMPLPPTYGPAVGRVPLPADTAVARGAYLAGPVGHCIECHTPTGPGGGRDWSRTGAGGPPLATPFGPVVPRNITPSRRDGIGGWSDDDIRRAVSEGIAPDGRRLAPPMAYPYYARMRRAELDDLVAYLRSLPATP